MTDPKPALTMTDVEYAKARRQLSVNAVRAGIEAADAAALAAVRARNPDLARQWDEAEAHRIARGGQ